MEAQQMEKELEERENRTDSRATSPDSGYNRKDSRDSGYDNRGFESAEPSHTTGSTVVDSNHRNGRIRQRQLSNQATNGIAETPT